MRFEIEVWPIPLDARNPVMVHAHHELSDRPIRRLHVHSCLELGVCHAGNGVFQIAEKVQNFAAGDVVLITSAEPHFARSAPGTTSVWTWIYLDHSRLLASSMVEPSWTDTSGFCGRGFVNVFSPAVHPELCDAIARLARELSVRRRGQKVLLRTLLVEILVRVHRAYPRKPTQQVPEFERIAPALQAISGDLTQPLRMRELARLCGYSEPQFRRVFQRTMSRSPLAYIHDLRVRFAASLLRGSALSVLEISLQCGFDSVSSFQRAFHARMGVSPRQWRGRETRREKGKGSIPPNTEFYQE
jgi:AraC family transcriptional activator of mtrCDE